MLFCDPSWRSTLLEIQERTGLPTCGYNTAAHERIPGNTTGVIMDVIYRRVMPGISYLLTRAMVEQVVAWLAKNPEPHWHHDWTVPRILGNNCAVTKQSVVDHIGAGGMHHDGSEGFDGGDRCLNPSRWLVAKRAEIVEKLKYATV